MGNPPKVEDGPGGGTTVEEWLDGRRPIASYARISRNLHGSMGIVRQHRNTDEFAADHNLAVTAQYTDNDITAADPRIKRPAFLRLIRDMGARKTEDSIPVHGVIAVEEVRVVRLPEDYLRLYRSLTVDESGIYVLTDTDTLVHAHDDSGILREIFKSAFGESEVERIKRRTIRNARDLAREGKPVGRGRFGWLPADPLSARGANEKLDPEQSKIIRKAIDLRTSGKGWRTITLEIKEEIRKIDPARAERLVRGTVKYWVTNPANCGYRMLDGELVKDKGTGEPIVGNWETICTPDEWRARVRDCPEYFCPEGLKKTDNTVKRRNNQGKRKGTRKDFAESARKYLSSGLLRCGRETEEGMCFGYLNGTSNENNYNKDKKRLPQYRCIKCGKLGRRMDLVDRTIEGIVVKELVKTYSSKEPEAKEWHGNETLTNLKMQKRKIKERFREGRIHGDDLFDLLEDLDGKIEHAEEDREQFEKEQARADFLSQFTDARWKEWDLRQKRVAIDSVLSAVIVHPVPKGRSKRAPFDPTLLKPIFRTPPQETTGHA